MISVQVSSMHTIEWIPFEPPITFGPEHHFQNDKYEKRTDTVQGLGLNQPGVVLLTEEGKQILVGDVDPEGGTCGCCAELRDVTVIKAYAVLKFQVVSK